MITCVAANPSIDKVFEVERLERGSVHRPLAFLQVPGGKAINTARAAAALGGAVEVVGFAGGHAGGWVAQELAGAGIETHLVEATAETRSCFSVLDRESGRLTEFYEAGGAITEAEWDALERAVAPLLGPRRWLSVSGSLPPGAPAPGYARLLASAIRAGGLTAVDASGDSLREALASADLVKVNAQEAAELLGVEVDSSVQAQDAVRCVADLSGGGVAVVTRGPEGAVMCGPDGATWEASLDVVGPYSVGSGDSFLGGLLAGRERGLEWPAALALGLAAGTANAETRGPGRLDCARAEALAARVRVRESSR